MEPPRLPAPPGRYAARLMSLLAGGIFLLEFLPAFSPHYEYFVDELYYLACSKRLALGYVDHPPLAPLVLRASTALLGTSVPALRFLPSLAAAATVLLTGYMAHRMGGGRFAQATASVSLMVAPIPLTLFGFFSMNAFEVLFWAIASWLVLELSQGGRQTLWLALGLTLGLAFENKHTSLMLAAAVGVATLATPMRAHLRGPWIWVGAALALALMLPNLYWQSTHGWVSIEFYGNLSRESNIPTAPWEIFADQIIAMNPFVFPVWFGGLVFCMFARGGRYHALGWLFLTLLVTFMVSGASRPDRIAGGYPVMLAAGGVWIESLRDRRRGVGKATAAALLLGSLLVVPFCLPWSPEQMAKIEEVASTNDSRREVGPSPVPLPWAHRLGSRELVEAVAGVYESLGPDERAQTVILAGGFDAAGAIEVYGDRHSLPAVYSAHNNGYYWGPDPQLEPTTIIALGVDVALLRRSFGSVEQAALYECAHCMGWRTNLPIYIARKPDRTLAQLWPELRRIGLPTRKYLMLMREGVSE